MITRRSLFAIIFAAFFQKPKALPISGVAIAHAARAAERVTLSEYHYFYMGEPWVARVLDDVVLDYQRDFSRITSGVLELVPIQRKPPWIP